MRNKLALTICLRYVDVAQVLGRWGGPGSSSTAFFLAFVAAARIRAISLLRFLLSLGDSVRLQTKQGYDYAERRSTRAAQCKFRLIDGEGYPQLMTLPVRDSMAGVCDGRNAISPNFGPSWLARRATVPKVESVAATEDVKTHIMHRQR